MSAGTSDLPGRYRHLRLKSFSEGIKGNLKHVSKAKGLFLTLETAESTVEAAVNLVKESSSLTFTPKSGQAVLTKSCYLITFFQQLLNKSNK